MKNEKPVCILYTNMNGLNIFCRNIQTENISIHWKKILVMILKYYTILYRRIPNNLSFSTESLYFKEFVYSYWIFFSVWVFSWLPVPTHMS